MRVLTLILACLPLTAQSPPKPEPAVYQAHTTAGELTVAADFLGHSFQGTEGMFLAEDFLVVDVALYPVRSSEVDVSHSHFALQLNKAKFPILPQAPGFVAASLKYDDWTQRPNLTAVAGVGDGAIILGRPQASERFPGDPRPQQRRLPDPPQAPTHEDRSGIERAPAATPAEIAVSEALPEGPITGPVRGYLYFPYKGKLKSIRKAVLIYRGTTSLFLR